MMNDTLRRMNKKASNFQVAVSRCDPHYLGVFGKGWVVKADVFEHYSMLTGASRPTVYNHFGDLVMDYDEAKEGKVVFIRRKHTQDAEHLWPALSHMMGSALSIVGACEQLSTTAEQATHSVGRLNEALEQHPTILEEYRERLENAVESITHTRKELMRALKEVSE